MLLVVLNECGIDAGLLICDLMKTKDMRTNRAQEESHVYLQHSLEVRVLYGEDLLIDC